MTGKKKRTIILAIAAVLLALVVWTVWGNTALELNTYTVGSKELPDAFDGYRIAHVSDLHNAEMGDGNEKLLAVLREADPDIIAITGDLIDSRNTNIEVALAFQGFFIMMCVGIYSGICGESYENRSLLLCHRQSRSTSF